MHKRSAKCKDKTLNMRREPLWLLSLPWSLSASGGKSKPIFNSFVFNLGLISSIPLYLREAGWKVKPNHHRVTKLVYCLLLIPLHLSTRHFCHILPPMPKLKPTSVLATRHTICHNRLWIKLPWKRFSGWFISYFLFKFNFPENAKYSPSLSFLKWQNNDLSSPPTKSKMAGLQCAIFISIHICNVCIVPSIMCLRMQLIKPSRLFVSFLLTSSSLLLSRSRLTEPELVKKCKAEMGFLAQRLHLTS